MTVVRATDGVPTSLSYPLSPADARYEATGSVSDVGDGLDIQLGGRRHATPDDVVRRLRLVLDPPVELVLPAHGDPTDRAALERVVSKQPPGDSGRASGSFDTLRTDLTAPRRRYPGPPFAV